MQFDFMAHSCQTSLLLGPLALISCTHVLFCFLSILLTWSQNMRSVSLEEAVCYFVCRAPSCSMVMCPCTCEAMMPRRASLPLFMLCSGIWWTPTNAKWCSTTMRRSMRTSTTGPSLKMSLLVCSQSVGARLVPCSDFAGGSKFLLPFVHMVMTGRLL